MMKQFSGKVKLDLMLRAEKFFFWRCPHKWDSVQCNVCVLGPHNRIILSLRGCFLIVSMQIWRRMCTRPHFQGLHWTHLILSISLWGVGSISVLLLHTRPQDVVMNLPKVGLLINNGAGTQTWAVWLQNPCSFPRCYTQNGHFGTLRSIPWKWQYLSFLPDDLHTLLCRGLYLSRALTWCYRWGQGGMCLRWPC